MTLSSSRLITLATAAFAVSVAATPLEAQNRRAIPRAQADAQTRAAQLQYDRGVREGLREGETDARRDDRFGFADERDWQRGDAAYRQGFEAGYRRGYQLNQRGAYGGYGGSGGYGGGGYGGNGGYGGGGYGGNGGYGNGGYGGRGGAPVYANPATAAGYNDGYEQGLEDARDGDRYDPIRAKDYRDADNDYDRRFGTKAQWQVAYRDGFRGGYDRGYRESQYYRR